MNNKIVAEVEKIVEYIKDSDDYKEYLFLKEKLSKNKKATTLIDEIKKTQKEIVKKELKKENIKELEDIINNNLKELNKIPLYVDFIEKQEYLNDLYQLIKERLDDYLYNVLN